MDENAVEKDHEVIADQTCFVISPIGEPNSETRARADEVFRLIISPAASENNLVAVRSDDLSTPGIITMQIIHHMLEDKMVVADLTDHNANVFYELALRHAFRRPVVQLILDGQKLPFDVEAIRTVRYGLDLERGIQARDGISRQIHAALSRPDEVQSQVTFVAQMDVLKRSTAPESQVIMQAMLEQIANLDRKITEMSGLYCRPDMLKDAIPPMMEDELRRILGRYAEEIELLKSVRHAGVVGMFKRRALAIKAFSRAVDEESREIMVIGSSLKGLLQKEEYKDIADKLRFKIQHGLVRVKFLLTHPIVADFRASQENRRPTEIGLEVINSLKILKDWGVSCSDVRLYLGTPTCFAIKTKRQMLVNPYPYMAVSFDAPCLILEYSGIEGGSDRPGYFYDEFDIRHFGAWDTELSVHIRDYDETITHCSRMLTEYAQNVDGLLSRGRSFSFAPHS
jgi:hypothetical protein